MGRCNSERDRWPRSDFATEKVEPVTLPSQGLKIYNIPPSLSLCPLDNCLLGQCKENTSTLAHNYSYMSSDALSYICSHVPQRFLHITTHFTIRGGQKGHKVYFFLIFWYYNIFLNIIYIFLDPTQNLTRKKAFPGPFSNSSLRPPFFSGNLS